MRNLGTNVINKDLERIFHRKSQKKHETLSTLWGFLSDFSERIKKFHCKKYVQKYFDARRILLLPFRSVNYYYYYYVVIIQ